MSNFNGLYRVRSGKESDINFIYATFLRGLYHGNSWFNLIPKDIFFAKYKEVVTALIYSPTCQVKVACLNDDEDAIIGFSIISADQETLHWVSVKKDWRLNGIAKSLLPNNIKRVTHLTKIGIELLPKIENCVFNPFLA